MAKSAWGIEAGTSSVKAVRLSADGKGGVVLDDMVFIPLADYRIEGGDEQTALLGALSSLVTDKEIKPTDTCFVSLPGRNAFSRVVSLPPVGEDAIRETIANEARGQIPIKLEDAVWDYHLIDSAEPGELLVNLYAVKRDVVDALLMTCRAAGLSVKGIQLAPLGIYNFVKYELDSSVSSACVCIDIGAENTDLLIIDGEKTWLRVVPFAGNDVTKALLMRFKKLTAEQAETLKRKAGQSKDAAAIFEAMKPPLKELVGEIYRSVGFYKNQNEGVQLNKLVMMGNGSRLFNLSKFFSQQLQYEVHRVSELTSIGMARSVDPAEVQANVQSLTVAIGLALQALDLPGLNKTNLVPGDLVREEAMQKVRPFAIVGGALPCVAGLAVLLLGLSPKSEATGYISKLKEMGTSQAGRQSELDAQIGRDVALSADVESLNNVARGEELTWLANILLKYVIVEYQQRGDRKMELFWCVKPGTGGAADSVSATEAAITVNLEKAQLTMVADEGNPDIKRYRRTVVVTATAQIAIDLDNEERPMSRSGMIDEAKIISEALVNKIKLLREPDATFKLEALNRAFGNDDKNSNPKLIQAMVRLRELVKGSGESESFGKVDPSQQSYSATELFLIKGGDSTDPAYMSWLKPEHDFGHFEIHIQLTAPVWQAPAAAVANDVTQ